MNAIARNSIQQCRVVLHKRGRRRIHAISSTIDGGGGGSSSSSSGSSPQERSVAIAAASQPPFSPHSSSVMAKDIELLLSNIGVSRRCSLHTIENIIQSNSCNEDDIDNNDAANMIDIIAQISSI